MSQIRPVSDLRNNFADISHTVHETREPVILTKNGYGDMVVMSYDEYQKIQYEMGIMRELQAAELEAETTTERYAHEDVMDDLRERIGRSGCLYRGRIVFARCSRSPFGRGRRSRKVAYGNALSLCHLSDAVHDET